MSSHAKESDIIQNNLILVNRNIYNNLVETSVAEFDFIRNNIASNNVKSLM